MEAEGTAAPPEILARHAELAGLTDRAIKEYHRAGAAAAARPAYAEAVASYDAALRLLATLGERHRRDDLALSIELARGTALIARFGYGAAETQAAFAHARALADKTGDAGTLFHIDYGRWLATYVSGNMANALAAGQSALSTCSPDDPADVRAIAHRMVGAPLVMMGRFAEGATHLQASLALCDPKRHADHPRRFGADTRTGGLVYRAAARWCQGAVDAALTDIAEALAISRQTDGALPRCYGLGHVGLFLTVIDPVAAADPLEELLELSRRDGLSFWHHMAYALRVGVRITKGDHIGALEDLALSGDIRERSGQKLILPLTLGFSAQAQIALGRFDDAAAILREIEAHLEAGERWTESDGRRIEGDLMLARGDAAAAEACWRHAIDTARAQGAPSWELRAATRLARLLADRGSRSEATALLATACAQIEGGRDTPDVIGATALLRELQGSP